MHRCDGLSICLLRPRLANQAVVTLTAANRFLIVLKQQLETGQY